MTKDFMQNGIFDSLYRLLLNKFSQRLIAEEYFENPFEWLLIFGLKTDIKVFTVAKDRTGK